MRLPRFEYSKAFRSLRRAMTARLAPAAAGVAGWRLSAVEEWRGVAKSGLILSRRTGACAVPNFQISLFPELDRPLEERLEPSFFDGLFGVDTISRCGFMLFWNRPVVAYLLYQRPREGRRHHYHIGWCGTLRKALMKGNNELVVSNCSIDSLFSFYDAKFRRRQWAHLHCREFEPCEECWNGNSMIGSFPGFALRAYHGSYRTAPTAAEVKLPPPSIDEINVDWEIQSADEHSLAGVLRKQKFSCCDSFFKRGERFAVFPLNGDKGDRRPENVGYRHVFCPRIAKRIERYQMLAVRVTCNRCGRRGVTNAVAVPRDRQLDGKWEDIEFVCYQCLDTDTYWAVKHYVNRMREIMRDGEEPVGYPESRS